MLKSITEIIYGKPNISGFRMAVERFMIDYSLTLRLAINAQRLKDNLKDYESDVNQAISRKTNI